MGLHNQRSGLGLLREMDDWDRGLRFGKLPTPIRSIVLFPGCCRLHCRCSMQVCSFAQWLFGGTSKPNPKPIQLSVCLSVWTLDSVCLSVCLSFCLSVCLSVCLCLSVSVCLSQVLSVCLSVRLCLSVSVCLSLSV